MNRFQAWLSSSALKFCYQCQGNVRPYNLGYGLKNAAFVPMPPPAVMAEYEGVMQESTELPPRPDEPVAEEAA